MIEEPEKIAFYAMKKVYKQAPRGVASNAHRELESYVLSVPDTEDKKMVWDVIDKPTIEEFVRKLFSNTFHHHDRVDKVSYNRPEDLALAVRRNELNVYHNLSLDDRKEMYQFMKDFVESARAQGVNPTKTVLKRLQELSVSIKTQL